MLQVMHLSVTYRKDLRKIINDFSMTLNPGEKAVLIGEEGNGKSTLLKWIHDPSLIEDYAEAEGICIKSNEKTGYLPQQLPLEDMEKTVYEYFLEEPMFSQTEAGELNTLAAETHIQPGFFYSDQKMGTLSGGEKVKAQLARLLIAKPTVLLLDEPSNDLDIETLEWLQELISHVPAAVLFVSHDEVLIENTAEKVIHIELLKRKTESRITVSGQNYTDYMKRRKDLFEHEAQKAYSERREDAKRMERYRRIEQKVNHDLNSVSRQDPHTGRLLKKKMKAVKSMGKRFERQREEMTEIPIQEEAIMFSFSDACVMPAGKHVLDWHLDELLTPDGKKLSENISLTVVGPEKICITGPNGCGKTTLLKKIADELLARKDIRAAYMPQNYEDLLDLDATPVEFLAPSMEKEAVTKARKYLGSMRYTTDEMEHAIRDLSGGQKAKVLLLKMNLDEANVLILDEPTRNFSPLSAPVIRGMLKEFKGTVISVSHDRLFLRDVPERVYELKETGLEPVKTAR